MPAARYWRIVAIDTYAGADLELSALHLHGGAARLDAAAAIASTFAPVAGALAALQDDDPATTCRFAGTAVRSGGFAITWDFGSGNTADVTGLRLGAATSQGDFLAGCTLQYGDDGALWQWLGDFDRYDYPGAGAYTNAPVAGSVDEHFDKVALLLHMDGADGSAAFTDGSALRKVVTAFGNAKVSTAQSKFGGASIYFDGSADWVSVTNNAAFGFGLADFTVEAWIYITGGQGSDRCITDFRKVNGSEAATFFIDGPAGNKLAVWYGAKLGGSGRALSTGVWYHVALSRSAGVFRCFVDGVFDWAAAASVNFGTSRPIGIGGGVHEVTPSVVSSPFFGYIDDLRITQGVARYTANFTLPTEPFAGIAVGHLRAPASDRARIAASSPVPPHSTLSAPPLLLARDMEFGGNGTVYGTTEIKGTPDAPLRARVRLIRERDGLVYRETWSDAITGAYRFDDVDELETYTVLTYHPTRARRAVVADGIIPEVPA